MKSLRKLFLAMLCFSLCIALLGCESETQIMAGHISDITGALSTDYAVKVTLDDDDRLKEKFVDLQIRSSKDEQALTLGEEGKDSVVITIPKKDFWYNLTYLINKTNGVKTPAKFSPYEDFGAKVFRFSADNDVDLTLRVVAGQTKTNEQTKEEILALSEKISDEVKISLKKHEDK